MDSPAQIDGGSSKPFWLIRFKNVIYKQKSCRANYRLPKYSKFNLQTIIWNGFYTIPTQKILPGLPEPLELSENLKSKSKSTQIFSKICKIRPSPQKFPPLYWSAELECWNYMNANIVLPSYSQRHCQGTTMQTDVY